MLSTSATGAAAAAPAADQTSATMIARQAIVNAQHIVIGYELFNRSRPEPTHTAATDVALVFTALSHAGTDELVGKKLIFVNCTHESLVGGHLELVDPEKVVLEIPSLGHVASEEVAARLPTLAALRARGFHLAFNHTVLSRPMPTGCRWPTTSSWIYLFWRKTSWPCSSATPSAIHRPTSSPKK